MAALDATMPTLLDAVRALAPDGTQATIAEILETKKPILTDVPFYEGNLVTGHRTSQRVSEPTVYWRRLNEGVPRSKSTSAQMDEEAAQLEAMSAVDRKVAILAQDPAKFRLNQARPFIEAMGKELATTLFYGDSRVDQSKFTGFAPRYNDLDGAFADQIIDGGGTGTDNRSIYFIDWGPNKVYGMFPKGTVGGLQHMDITTNMTLAPDGFPIGDVLLDSQSREYLGYRDHYEQNCGLVVEDPRAIIRVANIDVSALTYDAASGAKLTRLLIELVERRQDDVGGNGIIYMPKRIRTFLRHQITEKKEAGVLGFDEFAGQRLMHVDGVPIRREDSLEVDEAAVTTSTV